MALPGVARSFLWSRHAQSKPGKLSKQADNPCAHRSQGVGSSQGPDALRLAPCGIRHQAAGRGAQPLAQRETAGHDSGAVPAALVPWRRSLQPARGRAGAAHHPLDSHAPSAAAAMTRDHSLPGLKAGSLPRLQNMVQYDNPPSACPFGTAPPRTCQSMYYQVRRYEPLHSVSPSCRMSLLKWEEVAD